MFINNALSNNVYLYQSWENLATMGISSRTGVVVEITDDQRDLQFDSRIFS